MDCRRVTWLSPIPQPLCPTLKTCSGCPKIPTCEPPRTRLLSFGPDLSVLPVIPPCPAREVADQTSALSHPVVGDRPKTLCPATPKSYYDDSLDNVHPTPEYRYRWKNETCAGPAKLTGYRALPFARPIPKYMGFKPRFPHPIPKPRPTPTTIELTAQIKEQLKCPKPCDAVCMPYRRDGPIMCVSQLHPYTPFSAAVKVTNTW